MSASVIFTFAPLITSNVEPEGTHFSTSLN